MKEAGAIKEIFFPDWLANTVVVRKKNGNWRAYVDFTNLNRACPKDPFPMPKKVMELLAELHDGVCGNHVGGCSLANQAMTQGFWWPQMQKDAAEYVRKYEQCQRHAPLIHQPAGRLNPVSSTWPFTQWGLDILDPFPQATGNRRFVLVAINYFTKWADAEALANIRGVDVKKFVWKNIITRFGVPDSLISNNGLQFDSKAF